MKIKDKRFKITALYERLSKDDEVQGESNRIVKQKRMMDGLAQILTDATGRECLRILKLARWVLSL